MNNLKQIGLGLLHYEADHETFPAGGTFNEYAEMQHGWMTMMLPNIDRGDLEIDFSVPWDHPNNREALQTRLFLFENPAVRDPHPSYLEGYAPAHYAANSHVLGGDRRMGISDVTDGLSNTILAGEIVEGFKPWGHPFNWRDPTLGLNVPGGFGSPRLDRVILFAMADGRVRKVSPDVDPSVLRALATPAGGETVDETDW
ncbi:MAG: DUF1559 domain-containing protein, partial [Planctomycetes bacterium]|nr:DUF1559 domain-containing protein [Planctomycetota bacterium]